MGAEGTPMTDKKMDFRERAREPKIQIGLTFYSVSDLLKCCEEDGKFMWEHCNETIAQALLESRNEALDEAVEAVKNFTMRSYSDANPGVELEGEEASFCAFRDEIENNIRQLKGR